HASSASVPTPSCSIPGRGLLFDETEIFTPSIRTILPLSGEGISSFLSRSMYERTDAASLDHSPGSAPKAKCVHQLAPHRKLRAVRTMTVSRSITAPPRSQVDSSNLKEA